MAEPDLAKSRHWTYDDYMRLPDDGKRYEILWGELVMTPSPARRHQRVIARLITALVKFLDGRDLGEWLPSPMDIVLANDSIVQPDLLFFRKGRSLDSPRHGIHVPPDLAFEVISDSSRKRDAEDKTRLYMQYGVREYWLVDPDPKRIDVFVFDAGAIVSHGEFTSGEATSPDVLPGFRVSLADLFA
ncbi:MAG: Uma2 family endonuclease [Planctomycetes bacterium]|nr:Uma2 family endonuclease [Planctomycetota bacterium]MBI3848390.1 Uma2 family endonuclease [Planctomycetota bacterium]